MDLQTMIPVFLGFIDDIIMPLLLAIAVLVFLWNLLRFAFIEGTSQEGRTKARSLMLWSVLAFVVILSIWGILNIVTGIFNLDNRSIIPDYMCEKSGFGYNCKGDGSLQLIDMPQNVQDDLLIDEEMRVRLGL